MEPSAPDEGPGLTRRRSILPGRADLGGKARERERHHVMFRSRMHRWVATLAMVVLALAPSTTLATDSPILARGVLRDAQGNPARGAVKVSLVDPETSGGMLYTIASTKAGVNGVFELRTGSSPRLRAAADRNNGYANFMLSGVTQEGYGVHFFSHKVSGNSVASVQASSFKIRASSPHRTKEDQQRALALYEGTDPAVAEPQEDEGGLCYDVVGRDDEYTMVGELHVGSSAVGKFTYGKRDTADSDISVKVSADGGNWSAGGTSHVGNANESEVGRERSGPYGYGVMTNFSFIKFKESDWAWMYSACNYGAIPNYYAMATRWNSGIATGWDVRYLDGKCLTEYKDWDVTYGAGDWFARSSNDFTWYSGAVKVFGAGFETKSGASTFVKLRLDFNGFSRICGSNDFPSRAARVYHNG